MRHGLTGGMEGWHGEGWYTITSGIGCEDWTDGGATWYESEEELVADVTTAKHATELDDTVTAWYHGCGILPDEVISRDPNEWIDVNDDGLDEVGYYALRDIAEAKRHGTRRNVNAAIDRYERAVDEFNDGITD